MNRLDFQHPVLIDTSLWRPAFSSLAPADLPSFVCGYQPNKHMIVWLDSAAAVWHVHVYASFEEKFHSKFTMTVPYVGGVVAPLQHAFKVAVIVQHLPDLEAFDVVCSVGLQMHRQVESSTIRLLRRP